VYTAWAERLRPQLRVVGLDDRGHGRTRVPAAPRQLKSWEVFYQDLVRFLEHLDRPVVAIGHSLGGTASLMVAARRPDLVSALILIEPGIMPPSWRPWVFLAQKSGLSGYVPFVTRASRRESKWPDRQAAWSSLRGEGPFRRWQDEFLRAYITDGMKELEQGWIGLSCDPAWEGRCLAMAPCNVWRYVPLLKIPTLVLYGALSTTFLESVAKRFRVQVPHALIKGFEKTGHFVPMERPDESAELILHFLRDNGII
jgi:pimeloyl-ACP methyl ester carboxylesterase